MENRLISVIIPLYNKAASICTAIERVISQTYQNFEIIVVNDGSTDGSEKLVKQFSDHRIKLIEQPNGGVSKARNRGISESSAEYVTFLDADDEWDIHYLETQISLLREHPECNVFVTNYQFKHPNGVLEPAIINNLGFNNESGVITDYFYVAATSHPPITSISVLIKKSSLENIGGFPVGIKSGEDLLTWAKLACHNKIAFSKRICATYNLGEGYDFSNLPPRRQDAGDPVGAELKRLYESFKSHGLKLYISHWHKMRASVAIRYGNKMETISEGLISLRYNPFNYKIIPLLLLTLMPVPLRSYIIKKFK